MCEEKRLSILTFSLFQIFSERYKMKFIAIEKEDHEHDDTSFSRENSLENKVNGEHED